MRFGFCILDRADTAAPGAFSLSPVKWHMVSICPNTDDVHFSHLIEVVTGSLLHGKFTHFPFAFYSSSLERCLKLHKYPIYLKLLIRSLGNFYQYEVMLFYFVQVIICHYHDLCEARGTPSVWLRLLVFLKSTRWS